MFDIAITQSHCESLSVHLSHFPNRGVQRRCRNYLAPETGVCCLVAAGRPLWTNRTSISPLQWTHLGRSSFPDLQRTTSHPISDRSTSSILSNDLAVHGCH